MTHRIAAPLIRLISCVLLASALAGAPPLCWLAPVAADGLVIRAAPLGEAGLQADVAALSPRLPRSGIIKSASGLNPGAESAGWQAYTVQPGDTMTAIALRFGVPVTELVAQNGLANAELIRAGLTLRVPAGAMRPPVLPSSGPWEQVRLWPWPPAQGQTLVIWLWAREPLSQTLAVAAGGSAADQPIPMTVDGSRAWALIPFAALEAPGQKSLAIAAGGSTVTISVPIAPGVFETDEIPASASDPILSQASQVQAELVRLTALFSGFTSAGWTPASRFRSPLEGDYPHTSPFGSRRTYGDDASLSAHTGEDYSAPPGTPVLAPAAGVVVLAEPLFVRGNAVIVDHGSGVFTGYWHLQAIGVRAGERVEPGQLLGEVGSTGLSTGAHLHWELRINGVAVDPLQWLEP